MSFEGLHLLMARYDDLKRQVNDPTVAEIEIPGDLEPNMCQLGLDYAVIDRLGRIWNWQDKKLVMIFDPAWLHPSKRWNGPRQEREVPKTRSPK